MLVEALRAGGFLIEGFPRLDEELDELLVREAEAKSWCCLS